MTVFPPLDFPNTATIFPRLESSPIVAGSEILLNRVAIAEPQEFARVGLKSLLAQSGFEVACEADSAAGIFLQDRLDGPTIIIVDPWLDARNHPALGCRELRREGHILLAYTGEQVTTVRRQELLESDIAGCVLKTEPLSELLGALRALASGQKYFSSAVMAGKPESLRLSNRELQVARLLAQGHINKEIASMLRLSIRTVETHRINLRRKLGIDSLSSLTRLLIDEGLV